LIPSGSLEAIRHHIPSTVNHVKVADKSAVAETKPTVEE